MADGLKVNFSTEEVESETRLFSAAPSGFYHCAITKVEDGSVSSNEKGNFGKPFWKLTLVCQEGPYAKRNFWSHVMLFEGALHSTAQLIKAVGMGDLVKKGQIPNGQVLVGKTLDVNVSKKRDKFAEKDLIAAGDNSPQFKNEVRGFRAHQDATKSGKQSLLPS